MKEAVGFPEFLGVLISSAFFNICLCSLTAVDSKSVTQPASAELVHADGQTDGRTDMTKLIGAFRDYANAPQNQVPTSEKTQCTYITRTN